MTSVKGMDFVYPTVLLWCLIHITASSANSKFQGSWFDSLLHCRHKHNGTLYDGEFSSPPIPPSSQRFWTGRYTTLSDWIATNGCYFHTGTMPFGEDLEILHFHQNSPGLCQISCQNSRQFALKGDQCICFGSKFPSSLRKTLIFQCNQRCSQHAYHCGGDAYYSVYDTVNIKNITNATEGQNCIAAQCKRKGTTVIYLARNCSERYRPVCNSFGNGAPVVLENHGNWTSAFWTCVSDYDTTLIPSLGSTCPVTFSFQDSTILWTGVFRSTLDLTVNGTPLGNVQKCYTIRKDLQNGVTSESRSCDDTLPALCRSISDRRKRFAIMRQFHERSLEATSHFPFNNNKIQTATMSNVLSTQKDHPGLEGSSALFDNEKLYFTKQLAIQTNSPNAPTDESSFIADISSHGPSTFESKFHTPTEGKHTPTELSSKRTIISTNVFEITTEENMLTYSTQGTTYSEDKYMMTGEGTTASGTLVRILTGKTKVPESTSMVTTSSSKTNEISNAVKDSSPIIYSTAIGIKHGHFGSSESSVTAHSTSSESTNSDNLFTSETPSVNSTTHRPLQKRKDTTGSASPAGPVSAVICVALVIGVVIFIVYKRHKRNKDLTKNTKPSFYTKPYEDLEMTAGNNTNNAYSVLGETGNGPGTRYVREIIMPDDVYDSVQTREQGACVSNVDKDDYLKPIKKRDRKPMDDDNMGSRISDNYIDISQVKSVQSETVNKQSHPLEKSDKFNTSENLYDSVKVENQIISEKRDSEDTELQPVSKDIQKKIIIKCDDQDYVEFE